MLRRMQVVLLIFNLVILFLLITTGAEAKLITGTLSHDMEPYILGIDFSEARIDTVSFVGPTWTFGNYDVVWSYVPEGGLMFVGQLIWLGEVADLSEIKTAPEKGYEVDAPAQEWYLDYYLGYMTYICITQEGHYVKFRCTYDFPGVMTIHYVYQADGSRNLDESTLVKPSSWGKIKWLLGRD